jgi:hypothetical protein
MTSDSDDSSVFTPDSPTFPVTALAPRPASMSSSPDPETLPNYSPQPGMARHLHQVPFYYANGPFCRSDVLTFHSTTKQNPDML